MKKSAVLIGHNFNSILAIARSLGKEGYEVGAIRTGGGVGFIASLGYSPEKKSRYINKYYVCYSSASEDVINLLLDNFSLEEGRPFLFPVDDLAAEMIDKHYDLLKNHFFLPNVNDTQGGIVHLMDKDYQKMLARESGVPVADGCSVKIENGKYVFPAGIKYPCYIKPETSFNGRKKYMGKCVNEQEARKILDNAANVIKNCSMLIEEYIKIDREYCIVGLCNGKNVCIPGVIEETVMGHESHSGVTCYGKIIASEQFDSFIKPLSSFLSKLGFCGLFTIDVLESGGKLYFCELNMRMGASGSAVLLSGVNLALMLCEILSGNENIDYGAKCREITFANEKPLINDFGLRYISWSDYRNYIRKADVRFLYSSDDKAPMLEYGLYVIKQWIKRLFKR